MSTARFDAGQGFVWIPEGPYALQQNIAATPAPILVTTPSSPDVWRIDYASLVLDYHGGDARTECNMGLNFHGTSPNYPFLAVSAYHDILDPSGEYDNRHIAQLTLPFYVPQDVYIMLWGGSQVGGGSQITGTVGLSRAVRF